jgi:hypothetical protein
MTYDQLVVAGKRLAAEDRKKRSDLLWRWADLALKVEPVTRKNERNGAGVLLRQWHLDTGCPYAYHTLQIARRTACVFPPDKRVPGVSYYGHMFARSQPEILREDMKDEEIREALGFTPRSRSPRHRVSLARLAGELSDPNVVTRLRQEYPQLCALLSDSFSQRDAAPSRRLRALLRVA